MICLVDEEKDIVYLDFSKAFDTIFPQHSLGETGYFVGKRLSGWLGPDSGGECNYIQLGAGH